MKDQCYQSLSELSRAADNYVAVRKESSRSAIVSRNENWEPVKNPSVVVTDNAPKDFRNEDRKRDCSTLAYNKPKQESIPRTQKFSFACFKCDQIGHKASECVNNMGNPFLTEGQENSQVTKKCAFAKSSLEEDSDLNMIHIEVEQNKLPAVLDSGASVSLISENLSSLVPKPTDVILEFLDYSRMKTLGTVSLDICITGQDIKVKAYVVKDFLLRSPILLGKDFHKKSGINVNYTDNTFSVPCPADKPVIRWPLGNGNGLYYKQLSVEDNYDPESVIVAHYSEPCEPIDADERKDFEPIEEGREELEQLIKEFSDVLTEKLGCTKVYEHKIETNSHIPVRQKPYKLSPNKKVALNKQIDQMLADGVISPSTSPWSSPIVLTPKQSYGANELQYRLCGDFRQLNSVTVSDAYPMKSIDEIFKTVYGAKVWSSLDLKAVFWQIPIREEDRKQNSNYL